MPKGFHVSTKNSGDLKNSGVSLAKESRTTFQGIFAQRCCWRGHRRPGEELRTLGKVQTTNWSAMFSPHCPLEVFLRGEWPLSLRIRKEQTNVRLTFAIMKHASKISTWLRLESGPSVSRGTHCGQITWSGMVWIGGLYLRKKVKVCKYYLAAVGN